MDNTRKKIALIFGIGGQDGSYLAEFLLSKNYEVYGMVRPASTFNRQRIDHIFPEGEREKYLLYGDITDPWSVAKIIKKVKPDEIYNLSAMSHVQISWELPYYTIQVDGIGVLNILEAVRLLDLNPKIYQASTSELFSGEVGQTPQNEHTPKDPVSPYGTAKLYGFQIAKNYREAFGMFICNGILFNHESPRRGDNFVTKKIINSIKKGEVHLGNLDASRDWGRADNYVEGMWLMLQQDKPDDYVLATGETHTVKEFVDEVCKIIGKELKVIKDSKYIRPHDVDLLQGNPSKAINKLGWKPNVSFSDLISWMLGGDQPST